MERIVIVGASLAGLRAAETLRGSGYEGDVTVIGAEHHLPYDRPPLSKRVLSGEWESDRAVLRKPDDMGTLDVAWRTGVAAAGLDLDARELALADGSTEPFDGLLIATGAVARRLPGQDDHADAHVLRTLDDSLALRDRLADGGKRVAVIGAGFIGLEVAATAREVGNEVVVLEGAPAPLMRGLGADMGAAAAACHADHDVEIRCDVSVSGFEADAVVLGDGARVPADVVVVGIGVAPPTDWLTESGLTIDNGVVCGSDLGTGAPGVFAAGDICNWHNPLFDETMRVEHWTNAAEQGAIAARNLLATAAGEPTETYSAIPFFWSEQYDRRIQFLGRPAGDDEVRLFAGSVDDRAFAALYGSGGRLRGVLGVNMPRMVMPFRRHFEAGISWNDALAVAAELAG
jgi:NADPH-dependent 2,4-dienoyl-CoA reductase/sulfur reductase-like enzyme